MINISALLATASRAQLAEDLRIEWPSRNVLVVDFQPAIWSHDISTQEGTKYVQFDFLGARTERREPGALMVPFRSMSLDLPSKEFEITLTDTALTVLENVPHAGFPRMEADERFGAAVLFGPASRTSSTTVLSAPLFEIIDVSPSRTGFVGTLRFYPVRYDPIKDETEIYKRIRVKVVFSGGGEATNARRSRATSGHSSPVQGEWYKMDVRETGIYKLDQSFFANAGISFSSLNIQSVQIFGNGGEELPENLAPPRPAGLQEIARLVVDKDADGNFDADDFILFHGRSVRGWKYNPATFSFSHFLNHFTETNHYFFTLGSQGKGMDSIQSLDSQPNDYRPESFQGKVFLEEERSNLINSGRQWVGQLFTVDNRVATYVTPLPGYLPQYPVTYRLVMLGRSDFNQSFRIEESGALLGQIATVGFNTRSIENNYAYRSPVATFSPLSQLPEPRSVLRIEFETTASGPEGWLDWIEILYRQSFDALGDQLIFTSPDTMATVEYELKSFSSGDVYVFDATDHANVRKITNLQSNPADPTQFTFRLPQASGSVREIIAVGPAGFKLPAGVRRIDRTDLRGITGGADFVIITPKEFRIEAERLKARREQQDSLLTLLVNVEDIFDEFSGGLTDPVAIRDFLYAGFQNWQTKPRYVLFFGNGHYDYKNIRTPTRNWIPPYESLESIHQINTYASDDLFALLTIGNPRVSVGIGRIPITSATEARIAVDRIIAYETSTVFDPWRNRTTFVADDGLTSTRDDGSIHTYQAEVLAQVHTPPSVEKKKIYIVEYPTVNSSSGRRKPDANLAIVDAVNNGTLVLNYTGHGNPQLWAHEAIFTRETSLQQLTNADRLTFLVAATCDYARYDNPAERSAGEEIMFLPKGGAIGVVTASRAVYSFENSQFNNALFTELFRRDPDGRPPRLGDVIFRTKQIYYYDGSEGTLNHLKFHLFADPAMRLAAPRTVASVDSINGNSVAGVVSVQALGLVSIQGAVLRPGGGAWPDFNGRALLEVFDSKRRVYIREWGNYSFEINGSLLYRGEVSVRSGMFDATVPIPKDVSYDSSPARVSVYAWNTASDAVGFTEQLVIAGTDTSAVGDAEGPRVEIYLEDGSFRSGDVVSPTPLMIVTLEDQSGINTSSAGIGHRLEATLAGSQQSIDLTDFYRSDLDTYQRGEARYSMKPLAEGRHMITVKAWDIHNNSSRAEISFEVRARSALSLYNVFNVPNPISHSTVFTFQRSSVEPVDVEVKIYTLTGRLIEHLRLSSVIDRFVQVPWNGKDRNGDEVANGIYFYKVIAKSASGSGSSEVLGKLTVMR